MVRLKNRRGLSTVVTSAILLTAVTVIGIALVGWSNSNLKTFESNLSNVTATNTNQINENIAIENINFCKFCYSSNHGINVTLANAGNLPVKVTQIQINGIPTNLSPPPTILPGKYYTYNQSYAWKSQTPVSISATTSRGSIITTQGTPQ